MSHPPNTAPLLVKLLEQQHQQREPQNGLLKTDTFIIKWRAKVGSFLHPDGETIISAGEPCGQWKPSDTTCPPNLRRPEDKRNVAENNRYFKELPLAGYVPASCIRGIVREWVKHNVEIDSQEIRQLLGDQDSAKKEIYSGKIAFLDAYPDQLTKLTLDIVNPQETFQVYHEGQSTPLSFYTIGDGKQTIKIKVAIQGTSKATPEEVEKVWQWVEQALNYYGVGSRTASGYGVVRSNGVSVKPPQNYAKKTLSFSLYSQGCYGVNQQPNKNNEELRPSHWRGWLRSWVLRFLLGVMSKEDAHKTLGELFGKIGDDHGDEVYKGSVRIQLIKGKTWGEKSEDYPYFYSWEGKLQITTPKDILKIILPVIKFAVSVGGVGRGWRRPLHIFTMNNGRTASRGSYLRLTQTIKDKTKSLILHPENPDIWSKNYDQWLNAVTSQWPDRINLNDNNQVIYQNTNLQAEIFSPVHCVVYSVLDPPEEPINFQENIWEIADPKKTRGEGMNLIYKNQYKRKKEVGGNAGQGSASCSWVSIRRVKKGNECQEIVCVFRGNQSELRSQFIQDLAHRQESVHLFGHHHHK
ncbi:MAG: RAMP superfamily CRISPR-associated protein [Microcystaceae cyanobacterium]